MYRHRLSVCVLLHLLISPLSLSLSLPLLANVYTHHQISFMNCNNDYSFLTPAFILSSSVLDVNLLVCVLSIFYPMANTSKRRNKTKRRIRAPLHHIQYSTSIRYTHTPLQLLSVGKLVMMVYSPKQFVAV